MSLKAQLEAIIYATETPISAEQMIHLVRESVIAEGAADDAEVKSRVRSNLEELAGEYGGPDHGIEVRQVAGGYRMSTKPEQHEMVRSFAKSLKPPIRLSLPALETLAVIAYKQPATVPEINEIRGVDSGGVIATLLDRKLIATAGRKQVIGRPILYKTTKEFLLRFGLKDVNELPSMEEFEKMAQLEFEDMEPVAEGEATDAVNDLPEVDEDLDEPEEQTAATADSENAPAAQVPGTIEDHASTPASEAEPTPAEAAPAAPSTLEQAETETVPHDSPTAARCDQTR